MSDRDTEPTAQRLELLDIYHRNRRELERREAGHDALAAPLDLRSALVEVRERIDDLETALAATQTDTALRAWRQRQAEEEAAHVRALQKIRRAKLDELARRQAAHGPGAAPLALLHSLDAERRALAGLDGRLRRAQAELETSAPPDSAPDGQPAAGLAEKPTASAAEYRTALRRTLAEQFSREDLRTLCFDLGGEYDDLPGEGRAAKARELLTHVARRDRLADLVAAAKRLRPDVTWPLPPPLRLVIAAPDGARYETQVTADTLVAQVQSAFLDEWRPPAGELIRYTLRRPDDDRPLDPMLTLTEAGVADGATLHLAAELLTPESPVGLTVEDAAGQRYVTAVRLDTPVGVLAQAFVETIGRGGQAVVELAAGPQGRRRLQPTATLYDERIGDGALLRISTAA